MRLALESPVRGCIRPANVWTLMAAEQSVSGVQGRMRCQAKGGHPVGRWIRRPARATWLLPAHQRPVVAIRHQFRPKAPQVDDGERRIGIVEVMSGSSDILKARQP